MRYVFAFLIVLCLVFIGSGCVSGTIGNQQLTHDNVSKIAKGVTTRNEVIGILGQPDYISMVGDGRRMMFYHGGQEKGDVGQTVFMAVPIIGDVVPTTNTQTARSQSLQLFLDANNVVQDYEYSDNTTETKTTVSAFGGSSNTVTTPNDTTQPSSSDGNK